MNQIHPLAVVDPEAKLGDNNIIGPFCVIDKNVVIGDNNKLLNSVTLHFGTRLGNGNEIFPGASISTKPQDLKFQGEETTCEIGDNNSIRENVTISRGTASKGKTVIGNGNLLMAYVHVAHDCVIGDNCVLANNATLAGHIIMGDYVILGGKTACLQFIHIGSHVITQGGALIDKDIPPFIKAARYPIQYCGVNSLGLQRRGFTQESINRIGDIYRYIFVKGLNVSDAVEQVKEHYGHTDEGKQILAFIGNANTGLLSGYKSVRK